MMQTKMVKDERLITKPESKIKVYVIPTNGRISHCKRYKTFIKLIIKSPTDK